MKTLKTIGILVGWAFLTWCAIFFVVYLENQYQAAQNRYVVSILEQVKSPYDCGNVLYVHLPDEDLSKYPDCFRIPAEISARVDEIEKQYQ